MVNLLTKQEINYIIKMLNKRLEEIKENEIIIKKRKTKRIDDTKTYLRNLNNNNITYSKVKRLKLKMQKLSQIYIK